MLSVSKPLTSAKVQSYYRSDYSAASSSYYTESETLRGEWHGQIAADLGLDGQQIRAEHFDRLAEGLHPITGERLIEQRPVSIPERPKWETDNAAWADHLATIYTSAPATPFEKEFRAGEVEPAHRSPRKPLAGKERTEQQKALIAIHEEASRLYKENLAGPEGAKAREYLAGRGITPELAAEFGLGLSLKGNQLAKHFSGYSPELLKASGLFVERAGQFRDLQYGRLMFPIQSASGETIAFAGRSLDGREPKYINSPETDIYKKSDVLYNLHRAKDAASEAGKTVVVEGYTDVIAAHKAGVRNVVAACGTALTKEHAEALSRTASGVVINMDGDVPGVKATAKNVPMFLGKGMDVSVVTFGDGADPAEVVGREGGETYYKFFVENGAESVYEWAFRTSQDGRDMADPFEQAGAAKQAIHLLQSVPADQRERYAAGFAKYLGVEVKAEERAETKKNVAHRAGNDLTLSCPKSGSLAALVGGDERVLMAHRKAVLAVNEAAEELIQARMGGNRAPVTTGKCIIAAFEHDTARPVDGYAAPQLHTHQIYFNLTVDESGQARSIQNHELFVCSSYLTAVYQNVYEAGIREAGYRIRRGENHAPEIDGFTQEYLDAESPRSAEIDKEMEAKGLTGAGARSIAAHSSREKKLNLSREQVKAMHLAKAEAFGNQPQRIVAEARVRAVKEMTPEAADRLAKKCVNFANAKLSERSSVFDHHEVMTAALRHARGRTGVAEIKRELEAQKAAGAFIEVSHIRANAPLFRYTTPELIADERTGIEKMLDGRGKAEPFKHTPEVAHLNEEQKRVVEFVRDSRDQIIGIQGKAGSGKTHVLAAINEMARAEGYATHGLAPSSKATNALKELKGAGIQAQTIQKFLMMPKEEGVRRCYIMDETSQTSARQFRRLVERKHPTDRIIVVGDVNQHDSVDAGRIFGELQQAGMSTIHLDKIVRQQDAGLLAAVEAFSDRDVWTGVNLLREQGRIVSIPHRGERFAAMAKEYVAHPEMRLVVNPDNPTRKELGAAIRQERKSVGQVAGEDYSLRILVGKDVTGPDRTVAGSYKTGDEVKYNGANKKLGIKAGEYAMVTNSDETANEITVEFAKTGRTLTYNPEFAKGVEIYAPEVRQIAVGDRLQFTQASKTLGVSNRDAGEVQKLELNGNIRIKLDSGRAVGFNLKDYRHLDYAYVMTPNSCQSMTETMGMAHFDTGDSQIKKLVTDTAAYVASSRFTDHFTVYTDDVDQLVKALAHHEQNATALSPKQVRDYTEEKMVA